MWQLLEPFATTEQPEKPSRDENTKMDLLTSIKEMIIKTRPKNNGWCDHMKQTGLSKGVELKRTNTSLYHTGRWKQFTMKKSMEKFENRCNGIMWVIGKLYQEYIICLNTFCAKLHRLFNRHQYKGIM